jgi:uncharacterized protein involved in exopolysaccharide biosynthesis
MGKEVSIDLKGLTSVILKEKWWILLITLSVSAGGVFYALNAREEFEAGGKILPEVQGNGRGGLNQFAGLASLAGVDLGSIGGAGVDAVRPDLYPDVITSTPFFIKLFKAEVHTKLNKKMTFEQYYHSVIEAGKLPTDDLVKRYPVNEEGIIVVNRLNELRLKELRKRLTANIDKKSGVISIHAKMPDPVVAAEVTRFAMEYLMNYVKNYRTEKLRLDVDYLGDQVYNSRGKYFSSQEKKARYIDQFQDMRLQSADIQRERIESEYRLSSSFYNELLKKYEEAKFKLHQETPVFQVLEPPVVPVQRLEPKRKIIVLGFMLMGGISAFGIVLIKSRNWEKVLKY